MDNLTLSYMAGIVDGEGSISIVSVHRTKQHVCKISVANCNYKIIELFSKNFGGKIRARKHKHERAKNWKTCYEWSITAFKAHDLVKAIFPYLIIKKRQAVLVCRASNIKRKYNRAFMRWHPEKKIRIDQVLSKLKDACKKLNKRGL
jgi:isocitrate dehydrogenase